MTTEDRLDFAAGGLGRSTVLRFRKTVVLGSAGVAIVALAGLLGYVPELRVLGSIRSDYIPMAPSTAGCFLILSVALFCHARKPWQGSGLMAMVALVLLITGFSLLNVVGSFAGMDLNFEDRLAPGAGALGEIQVGRMSPATGAAFIAAGLGTCLLLLRSWSSRHAQRLGHWASSLGVLIVLIGATVLLAYLYGAPLMYSGTTVPMAATTAMAFLFLGAALVAAVGPESFPMRLVIGDSSSARLSRVFLSLTVGMVLLQSILSRFVSASSVVNESLLLAVLVIAMGTLTLSVVARVAHSIGNSLDELNRKLRESEGNFRNSLDDSPFGVRIVTAEGETIYANRAILDIYGFSSLEELRTTPVEKRYTAESYIEFKKRYARRQQGEDSPSEYEVSIVRKTGEVRHLLVSRKGQLWNGKRQYQTLYRDITERKRAEDEKVKQLDELRRWQTVTLGREGRIGDLKQEVNALATRLGEKPRYESVEAD